MILVLTQICDDCDDEVETSLCEGCGATICSDCLPSHNCDDYAG